MGLAKNQPKSPMNDYHALLWWNMHELLVCGSVGICGIYEISILWHATLFVWLAMILIY